MIHYWGYMQDGDLKTIGRFIPKEIKNLITDPSCDIDSWYKEYMKQEKYNEKAFYNSLHKSGSYHKACYTWKLEELPMHINDESPFVRKVVRLRLKKGV